MPFTRKASPAQVLSLTGQIPESPPKIPDEMLRRFPAWAEYQKALKEWWGRFTDMLQRDRDSIQTQFTTDETTARTLQTSVDALTAQVQTLSGQISGAGSVTAALQALVQTVSNQLIDHIASSVAHGVASDIVGETDTQSLDGKTIGADQPGYARLNPAVLLNGIPAGTFIEIGPADVLLAPSPFVISGTLKVAGSVIAL